MTDKIAYAVDDSIAIIRLNRPEKKNAMDMDCYVQFADALQRAEADLAVDAILITGGEACFCSGNEVQGFLSVDSREASMAAILRFMETLHAATKPVLAAVSGPAIGIGTTLLLHCDLVLAADTARFAMPFVRLGICPEFGSSVLLQRYVGYQRANEILFFGEAFDAPTAHAMGIVNRVVPPAELAAAALEQARRLTALPRNALRASKALLKKGRGADLTAVFREEIDHVNRLLQMPEAREAFTAFIERRKPDFSKLG